MPEENIILKTINEALVKAGIDKMPEDFKQQYTAKLVQEAQQRLGIMALGELDEKGVKEYEELSSGEKDPTPEEMMDFFNTHIPDFQAKVKQTLDKFAQEIIDSAERLKGTKLSK